MIGDSKPESGRNIRPAGIATAGAAALFALLLGICPELAFACACGCGVFDLGTSALFPSGTGGVAYLEYDYMNQNRNWRGSARAPGEDNSDKQIRTQYYTAGVNYMWNHTWGVMLKLPYWNRDLTADVGGGDIQTFRSGSIGDIRVEGMYTGFSPDMSTGVTFGMKLPTGDYTKASFDRDTQIGTGSTDMLLGAYHLDALDENGNWNWFVQGHYQRALATRATTPPNAGVALDYRPGDEVDATLGLTYSLGAAGPFSNIALVGQLKSSIRARDTGGAALNANTGYSRILLAPGISAKLDNVFLYADVEAPAYQNVNGNQLNAGTVFKLLVGFSF